MARLTKIIAMAAGISTLQVSRLFGLEKAKTPIKNVTSAKKPIRIENLDRIKTKNEKVKIFKVMLQNKRSVFEAEFGRETPAYVIKNPNNVPKRYSDFLEGFDVKPGMMICGVEWIGAGEIAHCNAGLLCGTNFISGNGSVAGNCADNGCNLCSHGCGGEAHLMCSEHVCPSVNCGPTNYYNGIHEFANPGFFDRYRQDPYIHALFQEFQVRTSQELARDIKSMLNKHK
jgi:hypothetical protein